MEEPQQFSFKYQKLGTLPTKFESRRGLNLEYWLLNSLYNLSRCVYVPCFMYKSNMFSSCLFSLFNEKNLSILLIITIKENTASELFSVLSQQQLTNICQSICLSVCLSVQPSLSKTIPPSPPPPSYPQPTATILTNSLHHFEKIYLSTLFATVKLFSLLFNVFHNIFL